MMIVTERREYLADSIKKKMLREKEKLRKLYYDKGMSLTDIGDLYGCSRQYVQAVFVYLGIKRRNKHDALMRSTKRHRSKYNFKPEHDRFIIDNCDSMTDNDMALHLRKPMSAISYRRLAVLKCKKVDRKNFSPEEDKFILNNYKHLTDIEIANHLDRSLVSVTHHRKKVLNCSKRAVRSYTEAENLFIRENYPYLTDGQIAAELNRSKASIAIHRHEVLGLTKINRKK